jgi:hypothetical protein
MPHDELSRRYYEHDVPTRTKPSREAVLLELQARYARLRGLFEYMAGWNADHHTGVTQHEIGAMRTAAREGLAILDGDHGTNPRP